MALYLVNPLAASQQPNKTKKNKRTNRFDMILSTGCINNQKL